jgi:hypothetical protein
LQSRDVVDDEQHHATGRDAVAVHVFVVVHDHAARHERLDVVVGDVVDAEHRAVGHVVVLVVVDPSGVVERVGHSAGVLGHVVEFLVVHAVVQRLDVEHAVDEFERDVDDAERQQQGQVTGVAGRG